MIRKQTIGIYLARFMAGNDTNYKISTVHCCVQLPHKYCLRAKLINQFYSTWLNFKNDHFVYTELAFYFIISKQNFDKNYKKKPE